MNINQVSPIIRVSVVSYTNSLPFLYGLEHSKFSEKIEISRDIPSVCAHKLAQNQADIGIVPVGSLDDYPDFKIISKYCIGSNGPVDSVFIFSDKPIEQVKRIRLDDHSRTSNGLAKVLLHHYWKRDVEWVRAGEADAIVQIGDRTFDNKKNYRFVYDLSTYWKELTGLPFVFAVWISSIPLTDTFREAFDQAIQHGLDNRDKILQNLAPHPDIDLHHYLHECIDYDFDAEKEKAMHMFLTWLRELS